MNFIVQDRFDGQDLVQRARLRRMLNEREFTFCDDDEGVLQKQRCDLIQQGKQLEMIEQRRLVNLIDSAVFASSEDDPEQSARTFHARAPY